MTGLGPSPGVTGGYSKYHVLQAAVVEGLTSVGTCGWIMEARHVYLSGSSMEQSLGRELLVRESGVYLIGSQHLSYDLRIPTERVGTYDTQLVEHFFQSLVNTSGMALDIRQLAGRNTHHIIEATFKPFARTLRQATEYDPSSKGILSCS